MTDEEIKAFKQFVRTSNAVLKVLIYLIQDLVPIIGHDEANRLVGIISKAQEGDTQ